MNPSCTAPRPGRLTADAVRIGLRGALVVGLVLSVYKVLRLLEADVESAQVREPGALPTDRLFQMLNLIWKTKDPAFLAAAEHRTAAVLTQVAVRCKPVDQQDTLA